MSDDLKAPTVANGYPLGRPVGRSAFPLDRVVEEAIEKLPMETRLYPDVYSWRVTDAVTAAISKAADRKLRDPEWCPLSDEEIADIMNDKTLGMIPERLRELARRAARSIVP